MDGRPHPSANAWHPPSGFTTGHWEGDTLMAHTTHVKTAWIRRGPWGYILHDATIEAGCQFKLRELSELPELVRRFNEGNGYEAIAESGLSRSSSSSR